MKLDLKDTVTVKEIKAEPKNPFKVAAGCQAVLLVPTEDGPRERVAELLAEAGLSAEDEDGNKVAGFPRITDKIKLRKLRESDVIFTAVPVSTKLAARKHPTNYKLKLSKGVEIKNFLSADADLDLDPNFGAIVDALQPACHPYSCKVSQDLVLFLRGV